MAGERWYQLVLIWLRDPARFQRYLEALAPVVTRYGGAADQVFRPTAIHADGLKLPDAVNLVHYDSREAFDAFSADPGFQRIKPLREESIDMLAFDGTLRQCTPAAPDPRRVFGIEIARLAGDGAGYRRYEREGEPAMRPYGHHVDYVLDVQASPPGRPHDLVKISSFPAEADRARFERDPAHQAIETVLYPLAVESVIWLDARLPGQEG
jgi:uncharacterized protein (DUF1330 family)